MEWHPSSSSPGRQRLRENAVLIGYLVSHHVTRGLWTGTETAGTCPPTAPRADRAGGSSIAFVPAVHHHIPENCGFHGQRHRHPPLLSSLRPCPRWSLTFASPPQGLPGRLREHVRPAGPSATCLCAISSPWRREVRRGSGRWIRGGRQSWDDRAGVIIVDRC
jgi:hypothetical protein